METIITYILLVVGTYLLIGLLFAILFLRKGISRVDAGTIGTGLFFKVLLFPGLTIFWPYFLQQWLKSNKQ